VIRLLKEKPTSRRAVIQLYDAEDIAGSWKEIPCTCSLQFSLRDGSLDLLAHMRSNDATLGLPHDIFAFTMLQEIIARSIGAKLGSYHHSVGSLHMYLKHAEKARKYLEEGWQETIEMPEMPDGDPWPHVERLVEAERSIRTAGISAADFHDLPTYWFQLALLLEFHYSSKNSNLAGMARAAKLLGLSVYDPHIRQKLDLAESRHMRQNRK
jgi:thymidylate synthase